MALFGLIGKKKKKYKMSKSQKALMAQQEQLAALANEKASTLLNGSDADRKRAEDAAYESLKTRLQPEYDKRRVALENQLWGQGIAPNNDAYTKAMSDFNLSEDDAWREAARQSVAAGQQSQNSSIGNALSLFGIGAPNIDLPMSIYAMNQQNKQTSSPLTKSLFKLGNTALSSWLASRS